MSKLRGRDKKDGGFCVACGYSFAQANTQSDASLDYAPKTKKSSSKTPLIILVVILAVALIAVGTVLAIVLSKDNTNSASDGNITTPASTSANQPGASGGDNGGVETESAKCDADSHQWDEGTITLKATCEAAGENTFTCTKCGETKTEQIAALGHKWPAVYSEVQPSAEGCVLITKCENDPTHTQTQTASHNWDGGVKSVNPTCQSVGKATYTCSLCKGTYEGDVAKVAHSYSNNYCIWCGRFQYTAPATSSPTYYGVPYYLTQTGTGALNIRSGPSKSYGVVTSIPKYATVAVYGESGAWIYVEYNGRMGWCRYTSSTTGAPYFS